MVDGGERRSEMERGLPSATRQESDYRLDGKTLKRDNHGKPDHSRSHEQWRVRNEHEWCDARSHDRDGSGVRDPRPHTPDKQRTQGLIKPSDLHSNRDHDGGNI